MSGIVKAKIEMEVLLPADDLHRFREMDLADILWEVSDGGWIGGSPKKGEPTAIAKEDLKAELEAIGNDGSFFGDEDEERLAESYGS